ncbi:MAG: hypothetical protein ACFHXK_10610 [bacterium]
MSRWLKFGVAPLTILLLLLGGYYIYSVQVVNPRVAAELVAAPDGPRAARVLLLTLPDDRVLPVNYLREGALVFVGADGPWWRAFLPGDVPVQMFIRGEDLHGVANVVDDDPAYTEEVFARLRPDVPDWLPAWADAKLVVITLTPRDA